MPDTKLLDDSEVEAIERGLVLAIDGKVLIKESLARALCQTVRALESALRKANEIVE
jgi:hypothetical protein